MVNDSKQGNEWGRGDPADLPRLHQVPHDDVAPGLRIRSGDYGDGTVVAVMDHGIQVYWDRTLMGTTDQHRILHDRSFIDRLERI